MKKIITAINSPEINEELKKEKTFEIIGKDIQYREAILEILEQKKDINIIIIYEKILGKINIEELITKINKVNSNIEIIFFLEKAEKEKRKILKKNNINKIYIKNELNSENLIKIIMNKKVENKIEKEKNKLDIKLNKTIKKFLNKKFIENKKNNKNNKKSKIIFIMGKKEKNRNIILLFIIKYLEKINKKILIINFNKIDKELFFELNKINNKNKLNKIQNKKIDCNEIRNEVETKKYIKKLEFKINKNIMSISDINRLLKIINDKKLKRDFLKILIKCYEKNFDYIFIEDDYIYNKEIKNKLIEKSDKVILVMEKNNIGINEIEGLIRECDRYIKNNNNSLHIFMKNSVINSISLNVLKEIFKKYKKVYFYNFNKKYKNHEKNKKNIISINKIIEMKIKKLL